MPSDKAPTVALLTHFDACHRVKVGLPAVIHGKKHGAQMAKLWQTYGEDSLRLLISRFFGGNDFAETAGYSVGVFVSQVPKLVLQLSRQQGMVRGQRLRPGDPGYYDRLRDEP